MFLVNYPFNNNIHSYFYPSQRYRYLLNFPVSRHSPLYVALLPEPGADCLEGSVGTAPAVIIHTVLHVVVVAVDALDQVQLVKTREGEDSLILLFL